MAFLRKSFKATCLLFGLLFLSTSAYADEQEYTFTTEDGQEHSVSLDVDDLDDDALLAVVNVLVSAGLSEEAANDFLQNTVGLDLATFSTVVATAYAEPAQQTDDVAPDVGQAEDESEDDADTADASPSGQPEVEEAEPAAGPVTPATPATPTVAAATPAAASSSSELQVANSENAASPN